MLLMKAILIDLLLNKSQVPQLLPAVTHLATPLATHHVSKSIQTFDPDQPEKEAVYLNGLSNKDEHLLDDELVMIWRMGFGIDDDNEPVPENDLNLNPDLPIQAPAVAEESTAPAVTPTPTQQATSSVGLKEGQQWLPRLPFCKRKTHHRQFLDHDPSIPWIDEKKPKKESISNLDLFLHLFGMKLLEMIVKATNEKLLSNNAQVNVGEMLQFIGIWFAISTEVGFERDDYWRYEGKLYDKDRVPKYNFVGYMSKTRYNIIMSSLHFTDEPAPTYHDKFWRIRKMVEMWNINMATVFVCSFIACLDESMSIWFK